MLGEEEQIFVADSYSDFSNILYVPLGETLKETLNQYYSKLNSFATPVYFVSFIYVGFMFVQQILSVVLFGFDINSEDQIDEILQIISPIWCGGGLFGHDAAIISSFVFIIINFLLYIFIVWRAFVFKKMKYVSVIEENSLITISKYYLPISFAFISPGIPISIKNLINEESIDPLDIIVLIFGIIDVVVGLYMLFMFISPRIMLLQEPLHEWDSGFVPAISALNTILTIFSIAAQDESDIVKIVLAVIMVILLAGGSIFSFFDRPLLSSTMTVYICSQFMALAVSSLVDIVAVFVDDISSLIVLIATAIFIVACYFIFNTFNTNFVAKLLMKIEESQEEPSVFTSKKLAQAIKATIELSPPFIFSWVPIERFINHYSRENDSLLYVYARLVSAFPHYTFQLKLVTKLIKASGILTKRSLYLQLDSILQRRNTTTTPEIIAISHIIDNFKRALDLNTNKFWENVLQNNVDAFWGNIEMREKQMFDLTRELEQSVFTYENSPAILSLAINLHTNVTFNFDAIPELRLSLALIQEGKPAHGDRALQNLLAVLPGVGNLSSNLIQDIQIQCKNEEIKDELQQESLDANMKRQMYQIINTSNVGHSTFMIIYFLIATIVVCVLAVVYGIMYDQYVVNDVETTALCLTELNSMMYNLARYALLLYFQQSMNAPNSPMVNTDEMMLGVAPNWFGKEWCPRIEITDEQLNAASTLVRMNLEEVTVYLSSLDESKSCVSTFTSKYNNDIVPGTGANLPTSIVQIILSTAVDEKYVDQVLATHDALKADVQEFATNTQFSEGLETMNTILIVLILVDVLFLSLPLMLRLFYVSTQMDEIATAFSTLTSRDIRNSLDMLKDKVNETETETMTDNKQPEKTRSSALNDTAVLSSGSSTNLTLVLAVAMIMSFLPILICSLVFHFLGQVYIDQTTNYCKSTAYIRSSAATQRLAFLALVQAFQTTYTGRETTDATNFNDPLVQKSMDIFNARLEEARYDNSGSLTYSASQMASWLAIEDEYRNTYYPLNEDENTIPSVGAGWERLSYQKYTHSIDNFIFFMGITAPNQGQSIMYYDLETYYLWWAYEARDTPYFDTLTNQALSDITTSPYTVIFSVIMVVCMVFTYIGICAILLNISRMIRTALMMLIQMRMDVVINNSSLMSIITKGRYIVSKATIFQHCDSFTKYVSEGIAVVDKNLEILDKNPAFEQMFPGLKNLNSLVPADPDDVEKNPSNMNLMITDCWGKGSPRFTRKISIIMDDTTKYFEVDCMAIADNRPALENEGPKITTCILIFYDDSRKVMNQAAIQEKHKKISGMLEKVLPPQIVADLQQGANSISFNVHSVSVGEIRVGASKRFSFTTKEPHTFYNQVYNIFDSIMTKYPTLTKVRTFAHGYTYAGGLFMSVNKPEKHAEEAIKFALEILHNLPNINKEVGTEVNLIIGVHTGGPIVAGVLSIEMPQFQILGNVRKYSLEMKTSGEKDQVHITRAVYELIFNLGFNIVESESVKIGKENVQTYQVIP